MWMEVGRVKADIQKLNIKDLQVSDYFRIQYMIVDHTETDKKRQLILILITLLAE